MIRRRFLSGQCAAFFDALDPAARRSKLSANGVDTQAKLGANVLLLLTGRTRIKLWLVIKVKVIIVKHIVEHWLCRTPAVF